jgi:hypothetical protein
VIPSAVKNGAEAHDETGNNTICQSMTLTLRRSRWRASQVKRTGQCMEACASYTYSKGQTMQAAESSAAAAGALSALKHTHIRQRALWASSLTRMVGPTEPWVAPEALYLLQQAAAHQSGGAPRAVASKLSSTRGDTREPRKPGALFLQKTRVAFVNVRSQERAKRGQIEPLG